MKIKYKSLYGFTLSNHSDEPTYFHHYQSAVAFAKACGWDHTMVEIIFPRGNEIKESDILDTPEKAWSKQ